MMTVFGHSPPRTIAPGQNVRNPPDNRLPDLCPLEQVPGQMSPLSRVIRNYCARIKVMSSSDIHLKMFYYYFLYLKRASHKSIHK